MPAAASAGPRSLVEFGRRVVELAQRRPRAAAMLDRDVPLEGFFDAPLSTGKVRCSQLAATFGLAPPG